MTRTLKILLLILVVLVIASAGIFVYQYIHKTKPVVTSKQVGLSVKTGISLTGQPEIIKPANLNVRPMLMPPNLPLGQQGMVQTNQYTINRSTHTMQVEYVYTQKNPMGTSAVEQEYQQVLQQSKWNDIVMNGDTITATYQNDTFKITFTNAGNYTTIVGVNYTVNLNANEK